MARATAAVAMPAPRARLRAEEMRGTLLTVGLGETLVQLALSPITAVVPALAAAQGLGATDGAWLLTVYILALAGTLLVAGSLGDLLGHRRLFGIGAGLYAAAALAAALAPGYAPLLAARAVQGVGAAMVSGNNLAILTRAVPPAHQGKAIAVVMSASALAAVVGSALGTAVVAAGAWPLLFLGTVPLALWAVVRARHLPDGGARVRVGQVDWAGAALLVAATSLLAVALNHPHGGTSEALLPLFHLALPVLAAVAAGLLVVVERRARIPLLAWGQLRNRRFAAAVGINAILHLTMMAALFLGPLLAVRGLGLDIVAGGLLLVVVQASVTSTSLAAGWLYDRTHAAWLRTGACVALAVALGAWAAAGLAGSYAGLLAAALVAGGASGVLLAVNNTILMASLPAGSRGVASGMLETTRHFGHAFGVTIPTALLALVASTSGADDALALRQGFALACALMAGVAALGAFLSAES